MIPQILHVGPFPVNSFGLMVALGIFAAIYRAALSFERNGLNPALAEKYALIGGLSGLVGARVWYVVEHYHQLQDDVLGALLASAGFTFYGGFLVGTAVLVYMSRRDKLPFPAFADSVGPALTLAYAIGRLGCQLSGDGDYGLVTESWLGMSYANGVVPTAPGTLAFPTPLYESALCMVILYVLLRLETHPQWQVPFRRFGAYLVMIGAERFAVEFIRINPRVAFDLSEAQLIAIVIMIVGLVLVSRRRNGVQVQADESASQ